MKILGTLFLIYFSLLLFGCQSSLVPASQRGIDGLVVGKSPKGHSRPIGSQDRSQLYEGKSELVIEEFQPRNTNGSLFHIDDQRNELYRTAQELGIGQYVSVKVVAVQAAKDEAAAAPAAEAAAEDQDAILQEMLALLPQLDGGDKNPPLVSQLQMKVVDRFPNGDLLLAYERDSFNGDQGRSIQAKARLPHSATLKPEGFTTKDLLDVNWHDSLDGRLVSRSSTHWQDEYSLRLSGFNEAQSEYAAGLGARERRLKEASDRVRKEMVSFSAERKKLAKEREDWIRRMNDNQKRVDDLEKKVAELAPEQAEAPAEAQAAAPEGGQAVEAENQQEQEVAQP